MSSERHDCSCGEKFEDRLDLIKHLSLNLTSTNHYRAGGALDQMINAPADDYPEE